VWHPLTDAQQVITDVEREALREMTAAEKLEKRLNKHWTEAEFEQWVTVTQRADSLLEQSAQLRFWHACLRASAPWKWSTCAAAKSATAPSINGC
jgi:hypothetical protein